MTRLSSLYFHLLLSKKKPKHLAMPHSTFVGCRSTVAAGKGVPCKGRCATRGAARYISYGWRERRDRRIRNEMEWYCSVPTGARHAVPPYHPTGTTFTSHRHNLHIPPFFLFFFTAVAPVLQHHPPRGGVIRYLLPAVPSMSHTRARNLPVFVRTTTGGTDGRFIRLEDR